MQSLCLLVYTYLKYKQLVNNKIAISKGKGFPFQLSQQSFHLPRFFAHANNTRVARPIFNPFAVNGILNPIQMKIIHYSTKLLKLAELNVNCVHIDEPVQHQRTHTAFSQ